MSQESERSAKYREMVESPVEPLILRMAIPSVISLLITSVYNLADTYFVGRLGTSATGAVGIVYPLMTLNLALGLMFGKGTGTLMGRQLGSREIRKAEQTAAQGLVSVLCLLSVLMALGLIFIHPLVELLGATDSMRDYTVIYARYILISMPFKAAATSLSCILRFQGFAKRSMYGLASGAVLNILLDPLLMFGLGMGFAGAGAATMIGEIVTFFVLLWQCTRGDCIPIRLNRFRFSWKTLKEIFGGGFSSLLKNGLSSVASVLLNRAARPYGDAVIAAGGVQVYLIGGQPPDANLGGGCVYFQLPASPVLGHLNGQILGADPLQAGKLALAEGNLQGVPVLPAKHGLGICVSGGLVDFDVVDSRRYDLNFPGYPVNLNFPDVPCGGSVVQKIRGKFCRKFRSIYLLRRLFWIGQKIDQAAHQQAQQHHESNRPADDPDNGITLHHSQPPSNPKPPWQAPVLRRQSEKRPR